MDGSPIRVLATGFAPVPGSSPHASALLGMAQALRAELDMVTVKTDELSHLERYGDARMFRVPVGIGTAAEQREAFGRAVSRQLEAQPYDVVHVRGPIEGRIVAERKKALGFRLVYEVATFPDEGEGRDAEEAWDGAHDECLEAADLILVPTEAAARSLAEAGHGGKVAVVPPGVDVNTFDWWPEGESEIARLLYLGTFAADRDLPIVLSAVKRVRKDHPIEVLIAGDPDPDRRERLRTMVEAFELSDIVTVRGEPRAIALPMVIGAASVCLAPAAATPRFQDNGDLPQPLLEYAACRRVLVAAGVPGLSDVFRDEKEALVYPPGDHATLADSIAAVISKPTLKARLIESAYDRVRWQYSDGARRRRIAEVYEMLMPGSQRYDAWHEGFSEDPTGQLEVPSDMFALVEGDMESLPPPEDTGEVLYVPDNVSSGTVQDGDAVYAIPDQQATPTFARTAGEDTNPHVDAPMEELPDSPTVVSAPTLPSDTDELANPGRRRDPDTGDVQAPDS